MSSARTPPFPIPLEVRRAICVELRGQLHHSDGEREDGRRALAVLARTSRHFYGCALDCLWHTIYDIALLFHVLPTDAYYTRQVPLKENDALKATLYEFAHTPTEASLRRFFTFARRVRAINSDNSYAPRRFRLHFAAPASYDALAAVLQSQPFLYNLWHIRFSRNSAIPLTVFRSFHVLFGPNLLRLEVFSRIHLDESHAWYRRESTHGAQFEFEQDFAGMVVTLQERCPDLEVFQTDIYSSGSLIALACSTALRGFKDLMALWLRLDGHPIQTDTFVHLSTLPNLRYLTVTTHDSLWADADFERLAGRPTKSLFPVLRSWRLDDCTLPLATKLLSFVSSPHLAEIIVGAAGKAVESEIRHLFVTIAGLHARDNLAELYIAVDSPLTPRRGRARPPPLSTAPARPIYTCLPHAVSDETIEPLLVLPNVRVLSLTIHCPFDISDAFLEKIADAWPELDELELGLRAAWGVLPTDVQLGVNYFLKYRVGRGGQQAPPLPPADVQVEQDSELPYPYEVILHVIDDEIAGEEPLRPILVCGWLKPRTTLLGLLTLARRCPKMTALGISFDANLSDVSPARLLETVPVEGEPVSAVTALSVGLSVIHDPTAVAAVLADMFPKVVEVESEWEKAAVYGSRREHDDDVNLYDEPDEDWGAEEDGENGGAEEDEDEGEERGRQMLGDRAIEEAERFSDQWDLVSQLLPYFAKLRPQERKWKKLKAGQATSTAAGGETDSATSPTSG